MNSVLHLRYKLQQSHTTPYTEQVPYFNNLQLIRSLKDIKESELITDTVFELDRITRPKKFMRQNNVKIIHAHHGNLGVLLLPIQQITGIPLVTSFRGNDTTTINQPVEYVSQLPHLFSRSSMLLPVCNYLAERVAALGGSPHKIRVLYGGIDTGKFAYRPSVFKGTLNILSVGRLVEKKGHHLLLKSFAKLRKDFPRATLTIIGSGKWKNRLLQLSNELKLGDSFQLKEQIHYSQIPLELSKCDIFCAPSLTARDDDVEGIPNTLKEAMSTGLPVISTFHAGIPELVTSGNDGILVKEGDVNSLNEALEYFLRNPKVWEAFGRKARSKVELQFNMKHQLLKQAAFYQELL